MTIIVCMLPIYAHFVLNSRLALFDDIAQQPSNPLDAIHRASPLATPQIREVDNFVRVVKVYPFRSAACPRMAGAAGRLPVGIRISARSGYPCLSGSALTAARLTSALLIAWAPRYSGKVP